ncbi:serine/threonine protein kinase [Glycomyces algeriensis]|uniref:non-specific serine/threonine protein kinase n=1 Tax=Glycomyces algeriensis TaxID=256037 RepID=A0A9W6GA94_9ACTN|nr:serine/threonine protein kinase [Glycomyces algeriensis]MDA1365830.1 serine/threonine protein kinase [Glycomyces algeriensis]MDR7351519.1 serine/threonine-protein kinase [Glycomyces algeriensis]GLI44240.1 serine/threonine protein kinase [Glycomyces algeriensis]
MADTLIAGRYLLDRCIGAGGMGEVWHAHDQVLKRDVAVKILYERGHETPVLARARFLREAQSLAQLKSPAIVAVHDHGEAEYRDETAAFLVMELVEGQSLSALLDAEQRLPPDRTMAIVAAVADGLAAAHKAGIIHRDIKPANIVTTADGGVKLIDFGIAQVEGATTLTGSGVSLGTLLNASPEQVGFAEVVPASDIYSLGTVAYECLTGRPVFEYPDAKSMVVAHMTAAPPPLGDGIPLGVEEVVLKALEKDPEDRWPSAEAFAQACREALTADTTVVVRRSDPPPQQEPPRPVRAGQGMWPWRFGVVTAMVVAMLLLTGLFAWSPWSEDRGPQAGEDTATGDTPTGGEPAATATAVESPEPGQTTATGDSAPSDDEVPEQPEDARGAQGDRTQGVSAPPAPSEEEEPAGTVPDVVGLETDEAIEELAAAGFDNVAGRLTDYYDTSHCIVLAQDPPGNEEADLDTQIVLTYMVQSEDDCGLAAA